MRPKNKHNLNAGEVTLDIDALRATMGTALREAKEQLYREMTDIMHEVEAAVIAEMEEKKTGKSRSRDSWTHRSHAKTHTAYLLSAAEHFANTVESWVMLVEAQKRDEVKIARDEEGGE